MISPPEWVKFLTQLEFYFWERPDLYRWIPCTDAHHRAKLGGASALRYSLRLIPSKDQGCRVK